MAAPQNFRSAWNGFNRDDVVHYLEYLNAKHQNQVTQLNEEINYLRGQLAERPVLPETPAPQEDCGELKDQLKESEAARAALDARCAELERQLAAAKPETELDTYRRAQDLERETRTRAELVYYQTNGVLSEASAKVDSTANEITELADNAMRELTRLQVAVSESKHTLQDAAAMMKSIRPNS